MKLVARTALALFTFVLAAPLAAQCIPFGPACTSSGMQLVCSSPPTVGTAWRIGERDGSRCGNPTTMITMFGICLNPGQPVNLPLACPTCGGCQLNVAPPVLATLTYTWPPRVNTIPIPNDPNLVGATFCMQDFCPSSTGNCVCLSQAVQVTLQ